MDYGANPAYTADALVASATGATDPDGSGTVSYAYEWYEDGLRRFTGLYKLGERTGFWEGWYDNGRKWFRKGYRSGELSGTCQWWWRGGTLQDEAFFIGGIPCN